MRILPLLAAMLLLACCTHPHPPEDDTRAGLLRPVTGTGIGSGGKSVSMRGPSGHGPHGHMYMGSGFGASTP